MRKGNTLIPVLAMIFAALVAGGVIYYAATNLMDDDDQGNTNTVSNTNTEISNTNAQNSNTNTAANANVVVNSNASVNTNTTNTNTDTVTYFKISEWGVELSESAGTEFVYIISSDRVTASFSTTSLNSKDYCGAGEDGIGTLSRYTTAVSDGPLQSQTPIVIGGYYYYRTSPQSVCSQDSTVAAEQSAAISILAQSFASLRASE